MNMVMDYQNLIVILFAVTFLANFCGFGLWTFLAMRSYIQAVMKIREQELDYQTEKRKETIATLREMGRYSSNDGSDFDGPTRGMS